MVIRLATGSQINGALRYNEQKVVQKQAHVLGVTGFANNELAIKNRQYTAHVLENQSKKNQNVKKNTLHFSLSLHPSERISDGQFNAIVHQFMQEMGYQNQPYIIYRHHDTAHPHVHVVTTCVDETGQKINDRFIKWRINEVRQNLEIQFNLIKAQGRGKGAGYGQSAQEIQSQKEIIKGELSKKAQLESILWSTLQQKTFANIDELQQLLQGQCVNVILYKHIREGKHVNGLSYQMTDKEGKPLSPRIKASEFGRWATWKGIESRFVGVEQQPPKQERPNRLSPAQYKILAALLSEQLREYKKEQRIYYDSVLIEHFPAATMQAHLHTVTQGKLSNEEELEAVQRFETYKRSQLAGIIIKEQETFVRTMASLTSISCEMESSALCKQKFFAAHGVLLNGEGRVSSPINRHLNYQIDPMQWALIEKDNGPTVTIPALYTREERTILLLNEAQKPFKASYSNVRLSLLEAIVRPDRMLDIHRQLNENYVNRLLKEGPVVAVDLVRYLYQRGIFVDCQNMDAKIPSDSEMTYFLRFKEAPGQVAVPATGLLRAQIQHLDLRRWEQGLSTESGRYMVALAQCIDRVKRIVEKANAISQLRTKIHQLDAGLASYSDAELVAILEMRSQQGRGSISQTKQGAKQTPEAYMDEYAIQAQLLPIRASDVFGYEQTGKFKQVGKGLKKRSKGRVRWS